MKKEDNRIKYDNLMSMTDKNNIVLRFDSTNNVLSVIFLFCQEKYIALVTSKNERLRNVEVDLAETVGDFLRHDFIDSHKMEMAYKINPSNGTLELLYKREEISMSFSEVEEKLGIVPGCLKINK